MSEYLLRDEGGCEETIEAVSMEEAIKLAEEWALEGDYNPCTETWWAKVYIFGSDDEQDTISVAIDPEKPECDDDHNEHDWEPEQSGCDENPGVWGHGGGVVINEICSRCGLKKVTDTWAQDMSTGEQGLTSVCYKKTNDY